MCTRLHTLSVHEALPLCGALPRHAVTARRGLHAPAHEAAAHHALEHRSEEHPSELQSLMRSSYAVSCVKKKKSSHHSPQAALTRYPTQPTRQQVPTMSTVRSRLHPVVTSSVSITT